MAPDRPDLLSKARPIASLRNEDGYAWISPDELLIIRPDTPQSCLYPVRRAADQEVPCTAHHLRISTGEETPLAEFNYQNANRLLAKSMIMTAQGEGVFDIARNPPYFALSPDGRYLVWDAGRQWWVASLDGEESCSIPGHIQAGNMSVFMQLAPPIWLPDNRSWLDIKPWGIQIQHRDRMKSSRMTFVLGGRDGLHSGITSHGRLLVHCPVMHHIILLKGKKLPTHTPFFEVKLGGWIRLARWYKVRLPIPGIVGQVPVSQDGTRLAWLIQESHPNASSVEYSLWTSDLRGKQFQKIGVAERREEVNEFGATGKRYCIPHDHRWSPDGKQISFTYGERLFAVPA